MPRPVLVVRPHQADATLCDRPLADVVLDTLLAAGCRTDAPADGPAVVMDTRYAAVSASSLRGLVQHDGEGVLLAGPTVIAVKLMALPDTPERTDDLGVLDRTASKQIKRFLVPPAEVLAADDAWTLARVERQRMNRALRGLGRAGVRVMDPDRVWVGDLVSIEPGAVLWPDIVLRGRTVIREGAEVQSGAWLVDTEVGPEAVIKPHTVCERAVIGAGCAVGPMAHLRPGTILEQDVKVGNFVEVKKTVLRAGAKASHLSYLGDAEIGAEANVGAGTITCNYDGFAKHRTVIGAGAFIGSNTALVAPVTVGDQAIVGAGSVITQAVPDDALAVARAPQKTLEGRAGTLRRRYKTRAGKDNG